LFFSFVICKKTSGAIFTRGYIIRTHRVLVLARTARKAVVGSTVWVADSSLLTFEAVVHVVVKICRSAWIGKKFTNTTIFTWRDRGGCLVHVLPRCANLAWGLFDVNW
jgi:hypothetical protein